MAEFGIMCFLILAGFGVGFWGASMMFAAIKDL